MHTTVTVSELDPEEMRSWTQLCMNIDPADRTVIFAGETLFAHGLLLGDIVTSVNGVAVTTRADLLSLWRR